MPFYDHYPKSLKEFSEKVLRTHPDYFPELTPDQNKIEAEAEQNFLNCVFLLMEDPPTSIPRVGYVGMRPKIGSRSVAGKKAELTESEEKELKDKAELIRRRDEELTKKLVAAEKRKEQIQTLFSEKYSNSGYIEFLKEDYHYTKWPELTDKGIERISIKNMLKCLDTLKPPLNPSELEIFKKSDIFQKQAHTLLVILLKDNPNIFSKEKEGEKLSKSTNITQIEKIIEDLFDCLNVEWLNEPFLEKEKDLSVAIRPGVLKYLVSIKDPKKLARFIPYLNAPEDYDKIIEYALTLKDAPILKFLDKGLLTESFNKIISSGRVKDILQLAEQIVKNPDLIEIMSDSALANLLYYLAKNGLSTTARKLIILYPEKITIGVLNNIKFKAKILTLMRSVKDLGVEASYESLRQQHPKRMEEQVLVASSQEVKESAETAFPKKEDETVDGPTFITHQLFAHIQNYKMIMKHQEPNYKVGILAKI